MNLERTIAHDLLSIGAVFLRPDEPFTWASGIKSPIYCDNRLTLTAPTVRTHVEEGLAELVRTHYPEAQVLMGTSTAGIAHAAIVGHLMNLPMGYVRSGNKDHGRQNRIEGRLEKGQKVVVVEDLISTAGSCIEVVEALRDAGAEVLGIVSIFTYGLQKGLDRLAAAHITNVSLSNFDAVCEVAAEEGQIRPEDIERLRAFRSNPSDEGWIAVKYPPPSSLKKRPAPLALLPFLCRVLAPLLFFSGVRRDYLPTAISEGGTSCPETSLMSSTSLWRRSTS